MNQKIKSILVVAIVAMMLLVATGCSQELSPYQINDGEDYTVSVKFDANGGFFATNTSVIVDSYNISKMDKDSSGNVNLALLSPDNEVRGIDAYTATNPDHFLAGWYAQRTETAEGFSYSQKWDFATDRLAVPAGEYTSTEPVLTLYAVWVPMFEIEFYALDSGELLNTYTFNPTTTDEILVPKWDEETGAIEMYDFPARDGYTFNGVYYDAAGTQAVDTPAVAHPGMVDAATGVAQDPSMKLYVDWVEGEWYHIYNAEQFLDNASVSGNYVIHEDLDFEGEIWPTSLMHGNFSGIIEGNGHTMKNITVEQTNNSKVNTGMFGSLTETAAISDVTFENVTVTIKGGTRVAGSSFGLLAGVVSDSAKLEGVKITNGLLNIDASAYFGTEDYVIGLVCGMGSADVDHDITAAVIGEGLYAVENNGLVTLTTEAPAQEETLTEEVIVEETPEETTAE